MNKISGILPVLHTPLLGDGTLDKPALTKIVKFLVAKSIGGLWVLGTGGEDMNLTFAQRREVVDVVVSANQDKKPLIIGCSFYSMHESLEFVEFLNRYNLHGIHYMPYHQLISLERIKFIYSEIAAASHNPVWMYSSANWCQHIPPNFVREMKQTHNITGMKYSTSNIAHMTEVAALADDEFSVISAVASTLLPSLAVGVDGATSSIAGALPEVMLEIYNLYKANKIGEAKAAQLKLIRFLKSWPSELSKDNFLKGAEEKTILEYRKFCSRKMTDYYRDANETEASNIIKCLNEFYPEIK